MTDDRLGGLRKGLGRAKDAIGGLAGDRPMRGRDSLDAAAGDVQEKVGAARDQLQGLTGDVASFTKARPLTVLGMTLGTGVLLGLLTRRRFDRSRKTQ